MQGEQGNIKAFVAVIVFSMLSFALSFGGAWVALVGMKNPFSDLVSENTAAELATTDSLRAAQMALRQEFNMLKAAIDSLNLTSDSLNTEIASRQNMVKQLEEEIGKLDGNLDVEGRERAKKLAGIVAGLSRPMILKITKSMNVEILASLVLNTSARKAQAILDAMDPAKAAKVAEVLAMAKNERKGG